MQQVKLMNNHKFTKNRNAILEKAISAKAIIFDVDGVLIDSFDDTGRFLWSTNAEENLGLKTIHFKRIFSNDWLQVIRGHIDTKDHLNRTFKELKLELCVHKFLGYWLSHDNHINYDILNFVEALTNIHNIPLYIGTNQDRYRTNHIKGMFSSYFEEIFSSVEIGFIKPEAGFYHHIETALQLQSSEILLIDDTLKNIENAKKLGWKTHHYI